MRSLADLLAQLRELDVQIWIEGDSLRVNTPKGVLTPTLRSELAERKSAILQFLHTPEGQTWLQKALPTGRPPLLPASPQTRIPLSFAQQRLWFLTQLEVPSATYNIPLALQLHGSLDLPALHNSCTEIIRRHDALRTTFEADENGQAFQIINPPGTPAIELLDLHSLPIETRQVEIRRITQQEARRPFNLESGPLFRLLLLRLDEHEHILFFISHHIIADGLSLEIFCRDLAELYRAFTTGQTPVLPELPVQYPSFAIWQRDWLQGSVLKEQLGYWAGKLGGPLPTIDLPSDRPRPSMQSYRGAVYNFAITRPILENLKILSQQHGATLFMTLLAVFDVLLFRYTGQTDLLVGTPVANRGQSEIENLIGFFVNTLVLRSDLSDNPSFSDLLQRVRQIALEAYDHQDVPFEKLVETLHPERNLSHSPIFQVMFALENAPPAWEFSGLSLNSMMVDNGTAKFDLTLFLTETPQSLLGRFEYSTDLFDTSTIARMAGHLSNLFAGILADPNLPIASLPLLSQAEQHQLLQDWNNTQTGLPANLCTHHLIEAQVQRTPQAIAVQYRDQTLTYQEMNDRAEQLALRLLNQGIHPGALVGVCMERSPEIVVGLLGVLKSGAAYVPLDPSYPPERLSYMIQDSAITVLLSQRRLESTIVRAVEQADCQVVYLDEIDNEPPTDGRVCASNRRDVLSPDHLAYVIYTSGTTGLPKGAMITHRGLVNYLIWCQRYYPVEKGQGSPVHSSISFDLTVTSLFTPLLSGKKVLLLPEDLGVESLEKALQAVTQQPAVTDQPLIIDHPAQNDFSLIKITPAHLQILGEQLPASLAEGATRAFIIGGESLTVDQIKYWQIHAPHTQLVNEYGPTETVVGCCVYTIPPQKHTSGSIPIGRPINNTRLYVLDRNIQPVPIGVRGELYIGGMGVARGYLNRPELTAEKFLPDPFSPNPGARMYRTGDLARYLPDGNLECLGRVDFQVKIRGYRIELGEIDSVLQSHPDVRNAATWVWDDTSGKRLAAYIIPYQPDQPPSNVELRGYIRQFLPEYMLPSAFVFLNALPLTANGKVDYSNLPLPKFIPAEAEVAYQEPRNPIEQILASIWSEVLGLERVGIGENFFALGGHSLLAVQVISRARQALHTDLSIRNLFEMPTIAALGEYISLLRSAGQEPALPISRVPRDAPLPPSHAQQRLWFLDRLKGPNAIYNLPWALHITGPFDTASLDQALNEIVRRHETLRTCFSVSDGQPVQVIIPSLHLNIEMIDLQELEPSKRLSQAISLASAHARQPFDLSVAPLFRCVLYQLTPEEHVLLLNMHHIISDGWSVDIFMNEFNTLYRAFSNNQPSPLPELEVQYADFSRWQRDWILCEALERQISYWGHRLADSPALLQLPADHPRSSIQTFKGHTLNFALDRRLSDRLKAVSRKTGSTLFMVTCSAFAILLNRYSGQNDIVIGTPMANRSRQELESLIGFFVNTLPLRIQLTGNPTFSEILERVRQATLDAYMHQDVPFERLVEEIRPERSLSYTPVFQVMFTLQNALYAQTEWPGLQVSTLPVEVGISKFDLGLSLQETQNGLLGAIEYSTELFDEPTILRMIQHFTQLLENATTNTQQPVAQMPLLTADELHYLQSELNQTQASYTQESCIQYLFEEQVEHRPDAIAVRFGDQHLTYAELDIKANQLAHFLQSLGVGPNTLVGLLINRSLNMVIGLLGILKAGGAYLPLDPDYPPERLRFMLEDAQSPLLLTQESFLGYLPPNLTPRIVRLDSGWEKIAAFPATPPNCSAKPDDQAYVIYTSGSTGAPKGVQITQRSLVNFLESMRREPGLKETDILAALTPISFDIHVLEIFLPLLVGAQIVIVNRATAMDGTQLADLLEHYQATVIQATPVTYKILIESGWTGQSGLHVLCGGEAMPRELANDLLERTESVWNLYGPTETTVWSTLHRLTPGKGVIPIGRPIANTQVYVLDKYLNPVPIGVAGELYIAGAGVARGYLHRPEITAERFIPDPFGEPGTRMYRTGDLVMWRKTGHREASLEYLGRIDQQIKLRGYRIELGEIETMLAQHPEVESVVVLIREDRPGDRRLTAYVIGTATESSLRDFLRSKLPEYMIPSAYVYLPAFPLTPNNKVDRKRFPAPEISGSNSKEKFVAPRTATEITLARIMAEVLGIEKVGLHDNFFDLGGHSFLATQLAFRVQQTFQTELPLYRFFEDSTILGLAAVIQESLAETTPSEPLDESHSDLANITLDASIQPGRSQVQSFRPLNQVFLTGATGFLGAYLLAELLQRPDTTVHCLVRAPDAQTARQRLQNHLVNHHLWCDGFADRIQVLAGDLVESNFGLPTAQFLPLAEQLDAIIHCAARVNFIFPYETLKPSNVLGTQNVLRLASLNPNTLFARPVHHISTLSVFDPARYSGIPQVDEQTEPEYSPHLKGGYAQSKWAAEKLVLSARQRGMPVTIHRPGIISGNSQTGIWNTHDYFPLFVKGCIQLGAIPDQEQYWRFTPVDYVSQAIIHLITQPESINRAFHYLTPQTVHQLTLTDWLHQAGYAVEVLDVATWQARLKTIAQNPRHALYPLLPLLLDAGETSAAEMRFSTVQTERGLSGSGILCPPVDEELFNRYISDFVRQGFIDPAPSK